MNYLICRASDETAGEWRISSHLNRTSIFVLGRCWMDALELTMKCSKLLKKPYSTSTTNDDSTNTSQILSSQSAAIGENSFLSTSFSDNDFEISRLTTKEGLFA